MPTNIFNLPPPSHPPPKINVSHTQILSTYLDPAQPPTKRIPFRQIRNVPFIHDVCICMPSRLSRTLYKDTKLPSTPSTSPPSSSSQSPSPPQSIPIPPYTTTYQKLHLTLTEILSSHPLRTGNYIMLAEPNPHPHPHPSSTTAKPTTSDQTPNPNSNSTTLTLQNGTLTLTLPPQIYQRSGLANSTAFKVTQLQTGARKHDQTSGVWRVEIDLRLPSMLRGRKGFDRLVHACGSVEGLREGRVWVVAESGEGWTGRKRKREGEVGSEVGRGTVLELSDKATHEGKDNEKDEEPFQSHHPTTTQIASTTSLQQDVLVPHILSRPNASTAPPPAKHHDREVPLNQTASISFSSEDQVYGLLEYISLLTLQSPVVTKRASEGSDPGICLYRLPEPDGAGYTEDEGNGGRGVDVEDVSTFRWTGFMGSQFVTDIVVDLIRSSRHTSEVDGGGLGGKGMWAAVQVVACPQAGVGAVDGYVVLLQCSGSDSKREKAKEDGNDSRKQGKGFTQVTCFEFVDSNLP